MSLLALAVIAAWLVVLTAVFNIALARRLDGQTDATLRVRAEAASSTVVVGGDGRLTVRESATDGALDSSIWVYSGRTAVTRPRGVEWLQAHADGLAGRSGFVDLAGRARFFALPIADGATRVGTVVAAVDTDADERAERDALVGSALVSVLLLAGAYPALRIAASRALRPVDRMTRQAAEWSAHSPGERFGDGQRFLELQALAGTLDALLDRLSAVLRHERQLSAELSHELRTPLAHIAAEVDIMLARPHDPGEATAAHLRIRERSAAMDRIVETLLSTARAERSGLPAGACSVRAVLEPLVAAIEMDCTVDVIPPTLGVGIDAGVLERIVAPILENAARFAARRVRVGARRRGSAVVIDVANDGPAIEPDLGELVFEPGFRGSGTDPHDGAGLGLALARRLARAADGEVTVLNPADLTTFRVTLPPG